jgi:hypothetical protein
VAQKRAVPRVQLYDIPLDTAVRNHGILSHERDGVVLLCLDVCALPVKDSIRPGWWSTRGGKRRLRLRENEVYGPLSSRIVYEIVEDVFWVVDGEQSGLVLTGQLDKIIVTSKTDETHVLDNPRVIFLPRELA